MSMRILFFVPIVCYLEVNMIVLSELDQTHQQIRDTDQKLSYMLEQAAEIESGKRSVEQRFGIILDANYYRVKASELKRSLALISRE
jgi:hypothetical protein